MDWVLFPEHRASIAQYLQGSMGESYQDPDTTLRSIDLDDVPDTYRPLLQKYMNGEVYQDPVLQRLFASQ